MGKYNVSYHGPKSGNDLQGVVTLTHNPLAIENISREKQHEAAVEEIKQMVDAMRQRVADLTGIPKNSIRMKNFFG